MRVPPGDYRVTLYRIDQEALEGKRAEGLAWFDSYWGPFVVNLDSAALSRLSVGPGSYIQTHVPVAGLTLTSAFARSWDDAQRLPPPAGIALDEC